MFSPFLQCASDRQSWADKLLHSFLSSGAAWGGGLEQPQLLLALTPQNAGRGLAALEGWACPFSPAFRTGCGGPKHVLSLTVCAPFPDLAKDDAPKR